MATYTLKVRRFQPESGQGPYWEEFKVDLEPSLAVLDGILQAKDRDDGSLSVRCSCRAAICGSCGMKVNGSSTLACKTQLGDAHAAANRRSGAKQSGPRILAASGGSIERASEVSGDDERERAGAE